MKLDEVYNVFITIYTQIHIFYDPNAIKFDLIIHDAMNKERRMLVIKKSDIIIFVYRNNKNKQFVKGGSGGSDFINRETYIFYKAADRKFKHFFIKC